MKCIAYKGGYKYQLNTTYTVRVAIVPMAAIDTQYIALEDTGQITLREGYAWDGPSGPTIDTRNFMRGSLVHDALYQLMREGHLDHTLYRAAADQVLRTLCREDGMSVVRAWWVYQGVRLFANFAAEPAQVHAITRAPAACMR